MLQNQGHHFRIIDAGTKSADVSRILHFTEPAHSRFEFLELSHQICPVIALIQIVDHEKVNPVQPESKGAVLEGTPETVARKIETPIAGQSSCPGCSFEVLCVA